MGTLPRFLLAGLLATALQYSVLAAGSVGLGFSAASSGGAGYLAGSLSSYFVNRRITFDDRQPHRHSMPRFYLTVGAAWLFTMASMGLMVDLLRWNLWLAQVTTTLLCLAFNYLGMRWWVFSTRAAQ
jgi:putative flippase GtrA